MHMSDALISIPVATSFWTITAGTVVYSSIKFRKNSHDNIIPLMGVIASLVFALQMINFSIPGTGSSGHFTGGFLLAAVLGPHLAFLAMSSVLIIQALFFADGGILALGCNIFNLAFVPSYIIYPIISSFSKEKLSYPALWLGAFLSLILGASMVTLQTTLSGISDLPFTKFLSLMLFIHLLIAIAEGAITVGVYKIIKNTAFYSIQKNDTRFFNPVMSLFLLSLITAGVFSHLASDNPDGLEWSISRIIGESKELEAVSNKIHLVFQKIQSIISFLPDYNLPNSDSPLGLSLAGIVGALLTIILVMTIGFLTKKKS
ncbi:MAG: energy-coupling factor ABC transporter permease [Calditerrivibrio sp.]|nr:energy-coupling factor ABC transporter permease [Calditerrivibrio sp.]